MVTIPQGKYAEAMRFLELFRALGRESPLRDPTAGIVEDLGLTHVQLHAVMWLGRDGQLTMGELARRLGSSERAVTGIVDRLERDGFANRVRAQEDRRQVKVELAEKGSHAFQQLSERMLERTAAFLSLLEPDDCEALFRILERVRAASQRLAAANPATPVKTP